MDDYQIKNFLKFSPVLFRWAPKKRLFIHIPKNGGMAIREAAQLDGTLVIANRRRLISRKYADGLKDHMAKTGGNPGYEHARLRDVDMSVRKATRAFAIVRNPWSRTVSRFKFCLQTRYHGTEKLAFTPTAFETFLEERNVWGDEPYFWHRAVSGWYQQQDYVVDERGKIKTDLLRQEDLSREIQDYFGFEGELNRRNVSKASSADYRDLYSPKTIQIVADWYAVDIDTFGFDFDTPATRNTYFSSADGA